MSNSKPATTKWYHYLEPKEDERDAIYGQNRKSRIGKGHIIVRREFDTGEGKPEHNGYCLLNSSDVTELMRTIREESQTDHGSNLIYHEIVPGFVARKPFFDIDLDQAKRTQIDPNNKSLTSVGMGIITTLIKANEQCIQALGLNFDRRQNVRLYTSSDHTKFSAHLLFPGFYHNTVEDARGWWQHLLTKADRGLADDMRRWGMMGAIDVGVWRKNGGLRMLGSSKRGRKKELVESITIDGVEYQANLVPGHGGARYKLQYPFKESLLSNVDDCISRSEPLPDFPAPERRCIPIPGSQVQLLLARCEAMFKEKGIEVEWGGYIEKPGKIELINPGGLGYDCPRSGKDHTSVNPIILIDDKTKIPLFVCGRGCGPVKMGAPLTNEELKTSDTGDVYDVDQPDETGSFCGKPLSAPAPSISFDFEVVDDEAEDGVYSQYSIDDPYYFSDFLTWFYEQKFNSFEEANKKVIARAARVMRLIDGCGETGFMVKLNKEDPFSFSRSFQKRVEYCTVFLESVDKTGKTIKTPKRYQLKDILNTHDARAISSRRVVFTPFVGSQTSDPDVFNTFPGFISTPKPGMTRERAMEILLPIFRHAYEVLANGNYDHYIYIISWLLFPLTGLTRTESMLFFVGEEGAGKDVLHFFFMKYVIGEHLYHKYDDLASATQSKFNGELKNKMRAHMEESGVSSNRKANSEAMNKLKSKITSAMLSLEAKHSNASNVENYISWSGNTNHKEALGHITTGERRTALFRVNNRYATRKGNVTPAEREAYFTSLRACLTQEHGDTMCFLASDKEFREKMLVQVAIPPVTDIKEEIQVRNRGVIEDMVCGIFEGTVVIPESYIHILRYTHKGKSTQAFITLSDAYRLYEDFARDEGRREEGKILKKNIRDQIENYSKQMFTSHRPMASQVSGRPEGFIIAQKVWPQIVLACTGPCSSTCVDLDPPQRFLYLSQLMEPYCQKPEDSTGL